MKKLLLTILCVVLTALLMAGAAFAGPPEGDSSGDSNEAKDHSNAEYILKFASVLPPFFASSVYEQGTLDLIEEKTEGKIGIDSFWLGSLVTAGSAYDECLVGVADIVMPDTNTEKEHFVVHNAILKFFYGANDIDALWAASQKMYEETPVWQEEFDGVTPLEWASTGKLYLFTSKPVTSLDELKGLIIRCTDQLVFDTLSSAGAQPVQLSTSELVEQVQKGVCQGFVHTPEGMMNNDLAKYLPYAIDLGTISQMYINSFVSNKTLETIGEEYANILVDTFDERNEGLISLSRDDAETIQNGLSYLEENGVTWNEWADGEYDKLLALYDETVQADVEELNSKGYEGTAIYEHARTLFEEYHCAK